MGSKYASIYMTMSNCQDSEYAFKRGTCRAVWNDQVAAFVKTFQMVLWI